MAPTRTAAAVAAAAAALCLLLAAAPAAAFTKPDQLELITAFRDAMLARPGQVNWTKALASWTCPTPADNSVGGTCDPCGQQVGCKLWQCVRAITLAACSALAAAERARCKRASPDWRQPGTTACHHTLPLLPLHPASQVWGNWEHLACRGERIAEDKYRVSGVTHSHWVLCGGPAAGRQQFAAEGRGGRWNWGGGSGAHPPSTVGCAASPLTCSFLLR